IRTRLERDPWILRGRAFRLGGQHDARPRDHLDRLGRRAVAISAAATKHVAASLDAQPVGGPRIRHPPGAALEPDLAMAPARVEPIDDDVAAGLLADDITAPRNCRGEGRVTRAIGVLDAHIDARERRSQTVRPYGSAGGRRGT